MLTGTALAGKPLQTITLQQVLALNPQPAAVRNLTLGNLLVADSALGQVTIGALALGSTPINGLGLDQQSLGRAPSLVRDPPHRLGVFGTRLAATASSRSASPVHRSTACRSTGFR